MRVLVNKLITSKITIYLINSGKILGYKCENKRSMVHTVFLGIINNSLVWYYKLKLIREDLTALTDLLTGCSS